MNQAFDEENRRLSAVLKEIDSLSSEYREQSRLLKEKIRQERERIWEDYARGSANPAGELQDVVQISRTEVNDAEGYNHLQNMIERLADQRKNPYFARIDFIENNETEVYYIGKHSLVDPKSSEVYICDWRADVSSLFYDFEKGPAYYDTRVGRIEGEITLRRQLKIEDSKLIYVFESDLAVEDEILKEELGKSSDVKMKTIVGTIQREQNRIIRDLSADVLVVDGTAGSGKTSVALHRAAYLLYRFRNTLSSLNILIFSPNSIFNAYIRDVLPELGEERVIQDNFYDFFSGMFDILFESAGEFFERLMSGGGENELETRGGTGFAAVLESALESALAGLTFREIVFPGGFGTVPADTVREYYERFSSYSYRVRCDKIVNILSEDFEDCYLDAYLAYYLDELKKDPSVAFTDEEAAAVKAEEKERCMHALREEIRSSLKLDLFGIYKESLRTVSDGEAKAFEQRLLSGRLDFSDLYPLSYLKVLTGFRPEMPVVSHIMIDEAQEYPAVLFLTLNGLFPGAKFTILGDLCQRSSPLGSGISDIGGFFPGKKTAYTRLEKTYRCTREISEYLSRLGGVAPQKWLDRAGGEVLSLDFDLDLLVSFLNESAGSRAVICRDRASAEKIFSLMKDRTDSFLLSENGTLLSGKIAVLPAYLAKGLEFDRVALIRQNGFCETGNKSMYYVGASRALHRLAIFSVREDQKNVPEV